MVQTEELSIFIRGIEPRQHVILFYDTPDSKHEVVFNFIADGLENKKGVVYVCSDEGPEQTRDAMKNFGVDVEEEEEKGNFLIYNYDPWYIEDGRVEPLKILAQWNKAYEGFNKKGLGMRVVGETSCFFRNNLVRELLRYEYALHKILTMPMEVICAYNLQTIVNTGYTDMIMPLIRAHGKAIFTTQGGSMILEPENVEDSNVEELLEIKI